MIHLDIDGIIYIHDANIKKVLIDFDDNDFEKGYVYKNDMLYLFPISDLIGGMVNLYIEKEPNVEKKKIEKAIKVPFEVMSGEIIIAGSDEKEKLKLDSGKYEIHFYIHTVIGDEDENVYDLYFAPCKKPKYKVLIKQKKVKPSCIDLINSVENTKEEAARNFDFAFKLPTYTSIRHKLDPRFITWQKLIMSDGSVDALIQKQFYNQKDKGSFIFRVGKKTLSKETKDMRELCIGGQKIFYVEEKYKPFLDIVNGKPIYLDGKSITFTWIEGKIRYQCIISVTKNADLMDEMKKVFQSLEEVGTAK